MTKAATSEVLTVLSEVLTAELTAINQYFLHAELCRHWGYKGLYDVVRKSSIDEMKHAESVMERILYLDGVPNVQRLGKILVGQSVPEQLSLDLALEKEAIGRLNKGIGVCRTHDDNGSRMLLEGILESEEDHVDWIQAQLELLKQVGEPNYLARWIQEAKS